MHADVNALGQYNFPDLPYGPQDAFRLLYLEKTPEHQPLRYILHDRLYEQERWRFVAVSYVCGDTTDLVPSICNGKLHHIYRNLDHALRRVRKHFANFPRPYAIWADGICINQRNVAEKTAQIAKMWQVFRDCARVVVCLGPSGDRADQALELFQALGKEADGLIDRVMASPECRPSLGHAQNPYVMVSAEQARAVYQFFGNAWFSRTWVVQEVNLRTDVRLPPVVFWGDYEISWGTLVHVFCMLATRPFHIRSSDNEGYGAGTMILAGTPVLQIYFLRQSDGLSTKSLDLHKLLALTWSLKAWDARDKIYGILALLNERYEVRGVEMPQAATRSEGKRELIVSYDEPYEKLYERIARIIIDETNSTSLLAWAGTSRPRSKALPSWVPDWSHYPDFQPLDATVEPTCTESDNLNEDGLLQVECFFLDPITMYAAYYMGELCEGQQRQESGLTIIQDPSEYMNGLWHCFNHFFPRCPTGERPLEAFARTLVMDSLDQNTSTSHLRWSYLLAGAVSRVQSQEPRCLCPKEYYPHRRSGFDDEVASHHFDENISSSAHGAGSPDLHPKTITLPAWFRPPQSDIGAAENTEEDLKPTYEDVEKIDHNTYRQSVQNHGQYRRFFISNRRYMGMGPAGLRRGDLVVLFKGCNLPFVLRVDKGAARNKCSCHPRVFKLIGEAYVHGLSANEPLDKWQEFTNGKNSRSKLPECAEPKSTIESDGPWVKVYLS
ncbi:hypothetical protein LTR10_019327 [Elasticomyces elasticus]|uniref:Heterokaryon incompatibility domain-containing protein n=1 Tax=Exophiala sideris TaxID=1016849 RepID=A0ABR0J1E2_9EURO|nr:hypothetical protein LTR10_019327 [Elasticomyces elasticus]KAK5024328.1 hypothetical protein LTS07_008619 [Exophiala sideris]KAK5030990.1 hypothetical protein LTR13_008003 [Exophiala sideris]KAK5054061.1 hypothetical protein LTR69_009023 [Exophiala sideris]KAK5179583.1 hypothetical protein LTR44_008099 [Eurotiomycetes sp. CCFEE 6388]